MQSLNVKLLKLFVVTIGIYNIFNTNTFANQQIIKQETSLINIGYNTVELSDSGINQFKNKIYDDFFNPKYNKFNTYEDCEFATNYLGKLVQSFNDEIKTKQYINNTNEIFKLKNIFNGVLHSILIKENDIKIKFTIDEQIKMMSLIKKVDETISQSVNPDMVLE